MTALDRWSLKIHAFLHDPPHKPLALGRGHAQQGASIAIQLSGTELTEQARQVIEEADHLAAGADRHSWLAGFRVDPRKELQLLHPLQGQPIPEAGAVTGGLFQLSFPLRRLFEGLAEGAVPGRGEPLQISFPPECVDAVEQLGEPLAKTLAELPDLRLRFLTLWRFLPELLAELESDSRKLGLLWSLLPADSRMPDHSVLVHDSLVSALALIRSQGKEAAVLRVQFAPIQDFIEASRKLRDLWASSSILAETTWKALEPIVEEFGPDHVVYPSLRHEPRFDRWLLTQLQGQPCLTAPSEKEAGGSALWKVVRRTRDHLPRALRTPSLPNVFTAIVPYDSALDLAKRIEAQLREFWASSAADAAREAGEGADYVERAADQARALLQVFWGTVRWGLDDDPKKWVGLDAPKHCWHKNRPTIAEALETLRELSQESFKHYQPNAGLLYADLNEQAGLLVDAAKRERAQHVTDEDGLKCTCCGDRQVLGGNDFWVQRTEGHAKRKDKNKLSDSEQLCGPCTWKRSFEVELAGDSGTGLRGQRHPSTGELAAAQFKLDVIRACANGNVELLQAVKDFIDAANEDVKAEAMEEGDTKVFCPQAVYLAAVRSSNETLKGFANIDGQWLLPFPREESSERVPERTIAAAAKLRALAQQAKIPAPRPYLAIVDFDGDAMGKWLSGTHENFPSLRDTLHLKVLQEIRANASDVSDKLAARKRFLTPAFHASISAAAAAFARFSAPMTIEGEELPGHLVYAGGDDALFVAPVPLAVELAWRLRLRFSGWPARFEHELLGGSLEGFDAMRDLLAQWFRAPTPWVVSSLSPKSGRPEPVEHWRQASSLGLAFGTKATASAGICVFHYRWPLGSALRLAREALNAAKSAGRNALGIVVQRRSGSVSKTVLPFYLPVFETGWGEGDTPDVWPVLSLLRLIAAFAKREREVSVRRASAFRQEVAALRILPHADRIEQDARPSSELWDIGEALARRVVRKRTLPSDGESSGELEDIVLDLGRGVRASRPERPDLALFEWAEALTVAAFLARPGEGI
ncbi:hypothetical protein HRbin30_01671 [bacterium HR30]|nr:hypothetical protein HRbin30_01671 [bacterium HR30]